MEKVKIDRKRNEVILRFNHLFYPEDCISEAIKDYGDLCDIRQEEEDG